MWGKQFSFTLSKMQVYQWKWDRGSDRHTPWMMQLSTVIVTVITEKFKHYYIMLSKWFLYIGQLIFTYNYLYLYVHTSKFLLISVSIYLFADFHLANGFFYCCLWRSVYWEKIIHTNKLIEITRNIDILTRFMLGTIKVWWVFGISDKNC